MVRRLLIIVVLLVRQHRLGSNAIHGDADPIVPYAHALRPQEALNKAGVKNQLFTIPGGGHGDFTLDQRMKGLRGDQRLLG
jgi:fermentation-respiration switch protein FrsA (DUF1100 family)